MSRRNKHIGSSFESWLSEAGIRKEVEASASADGSSEREPARYGHPKDLKANRKDRDVVDAKSSKPK